MARIRALLRRVQGTTGNELQVGVLRFDTAGGFVMAGDQLLELPPRKLALLEVLMRHAGRVVGKDQLLDQVYSFDEEASNNAIEVMMHRLRKKLDSYSIVIRTVRGLGYMLELPEGG